MHADIHYIHTHIHTLHYITLHTYSNASYDATLPGIHTYIHTYMHTYLHTRTYAHTHIHTYTHTYILSRMGRVKNPPFNPFYKKKTPSLSLFYKKRFLRLISCLLWAYFMPLFALLGFLGLFKPL